MLALPQIEVDIPLRLKHETLTEEMEITNKFYADYSAFKSALFEDLCERNLDDRNEKIDEGNEEIDDSFLGTKSHILNPKFDKLLLFKKTQKLLDRILFILFCEDRNLLPANSVMGIIGDWKTLKKMGYPQPLYNLFKTFFNRINTGFTNDDDHSRDIFAYNGGLFKSDEILDIIKVSDDVLYIHTQRLANYDFESQISVDILGRIFENSLTEIEEVEEEIRNEKSGMRSGDRETRSEKLEKLNLESSLFISKSNIGKRKKDGVFYTPEYITRYIVENTIGVLCAKKRAELGLTDEAFAEAVAKQKIKKKHGK